MTHPPQAHTSQVVLLALGEGERHCPRCISGGIGMHAQSTGVSFAVPLPISQSRPTRVLPCTARLACSKPCPPARCRAVEPKGRASCSPQLEGASGEPSPSAFRARGGMPG